MRLMTLVLVWAEVALATPVLLWEGTLSWSLPTSETSFSSAFELSVVSGLWAWKANLAFSESQWTAISFSGAGKLGEAEVFPKAEFDPDLMKFLASTISVKFPFPPGSVVFLARLEEKGFGMGLSYSGGPNEVLRSLRLRFNLKRYLDEVLSPSFAPSFSSLEAWARIPWCCGIKDLSIRLSFTKTGFEQLSLGLRLPGEFLCGLGFFLHKSFRLEEKDARIFPTLVYVPPKGLFVFFGVDMEENRFQGLRIYAFGINVEAGNARVRTFTSLAEEELNFLPDPYWEKVELEVEIPGCVKEANFKTVLYFGDTGVFGLGRTELSLCLPVLEESQVEPRMEVESTGAKFSLSWHMKF